MYNDDLVTTEQIFTDDPQTETQCRQDATTNVKTIGGSSSVWLGSTQSSVGMLGKLRDIVKLGRRPRRSKGSLSYQEAAADFKQFMAAKDSGRKPDSVPSDLTRDTDDSVADVSFLELVENVSSLLGTLTHCEDSQVTAVTSCPARPVDSGIVISDMEGDTAEMEITADTPTQLKVGSVLSDSGDMTAAHTCPAGRDNTRYNGDRFTVFNRARQQYNPEVLSASDSIDLLNANVEFCVGCKKSFCALPDGLSPLQHQPEIGFYTCYDCIDKTDAALQMSRCVRDNGLGAECVQRLRARDVSRDVCLVDDPLSDPDSDLLYQSVSSSVSEGSVREWEVSGDTQPDCHHPGDSHCAQCVTSGHLLLGPNRGHWKQAVHNSQPSRHHRRGEDVTRQREASRLNQTDWHRPASGSGHRFQPSWSTLSNYGNKSETYSELSSGQSAGDIYRGCCTQERVASQQLYAQMCYENYMYHVQCAQYYKDAYRQIEHGQRMLGIYTAQKHYIQHMGKFAARHNKNGQS